MNKAFKEIAIPGDKSISHRILMLAARACGITYIYNLSLAEDILSTINALKNLGVSIEIMPGMVVVNGCGLKTFQKPEKPLKLHMGNSGTSARLLMGLVASSPVEVIFLGDKSLEKRPMERVLKPLSDMGIVYKFLSSNQLPCYIKGSNTLKAIDYKVPIVSAQVKSSLLFANITNNSPLKLVEANKSRDHTEIMFQYYGLNIIQENNLIKFIGGKEFSIGEYNVPGDPSSAAFIIALGIFKKITPLIIKNICINPTRIGFIDSLQKMGGDISFLNLRYIQGEKVADLQILPSTLSGIEIGAEIFSSMIDEYPIFSIIAAYSNCKVLMNDLTELKYKESNRIDLITAGLRVFGYDVLNSNDNLIINNNKRLSQEKSSSIKLIKTGGDHRIAMSFIILAILCKQKILIDNLSCINTSFPNFFKILEDLGISDITKTVSLIP